MQVVARREPGHSASSEGLAFLDPITDLHADGRHVPVERLHAKPVIDDDAVAVDAQERGVHDRPALRRGDGHLGSRRGLLVSAAALNADEADVSLH